ncbi:hypothetical protein [Lysobacter silvisoli]|uniref:hypothetical protein n=1 Tax=Lysobacter silvisoli TaxID=2293254 RepID=UPI001E402D39|nr:hypothetical protein [Lysobacter silvisoli]
MTRQAPLRTPDGRYIVVDGRLWRTSNPHLSEAERAEAVSELMAARRAVKAAAEDAQAMAEARRRVDSAKRRLGERGPVWWTDGAPDYNRRAIARTPYATWYAALEGRGKSRGGPDGAPNRRSVRIGR